MGPHLTQQLASIRIIEVLIEDWPEAAIKAHDQCPRFEAMHSSHNLLLESRTMKVLLGTMQPIHWLKYITVMVSSKHGKFHTARKKLDNVNGRGRTLHSCRKGVKKVALGLQNVRGLVQLAGNSATVSQS